MKKKNFNQRTCCITNKKFNKNELVRICIKDNKLIIDKDYSLQGRGIYIHSFDKFDNEIIIKKIERKTNIVIDQILFNELVECVDNRRSK